ncbi:MAG: fumarate hydratase [Spirochaetes bacterium GWD1_27_9]|nr:MAG: fumarate hydratase [Spirochaetes bacterium GWB1_27_13]OHD22646.1 MAG: fumarate hydratase [Spirochaetes bacterium GWC1_27_15]OHD35585.1 MAG: fumarate hydratase [Spirochaetes bacterium GWD1_27_9]
MRSIDVEIVAKEVERLFIEANYILPDDVKNKLEEALVYETNPLSKDILNILKINYKKSEEMIYPLCQDTGMAVVFLEIGQEIHFENGFIGDAICKGVENAYNKGYLRKSVVADPLKNRANTKTNLPPVIHTEITKGDKLKITVIPKGFGAENQSAIKMLTPSDGREGIIDFIVSGVIKSGGKGCPPSVIGVGIGGTFEYAAILAKKALLISLDKPNEDPFYKDMEEEILTKINQSGVGSQGIGGNISCLSIKILTYPTHIAGLPVAYNYCCHSTRHKSCVI